MKSKNLRIFTLEDSGNVFYGRITKVVTGGVSDIVTIELDPNKPLELTVSYTPVPKVRGGEHTEEDRSDRAPGSDESVGEYVKVIVPVPNGFIFKGN